jgi:hypothetical protein|nr:MAG TPA: Chromatin remodeling complex ATPase [Caudoviricetes sp.]
MIFTPHDYQAHCIDKILELNNVGLFLDMGLGKTVITLSAIKELKYYRFQARKILIIAPKKVAEATWQKECDKWEHLSLLRISTVLGNINQRIRALNTPADIYIINRENVPWLVDYYRNDWCFDMVVVDEFSSFKSHTAKRFKALASVRPHIKRFVGLTGTPSPNGLSDLWAQVYLLDGGERLEKRYTQFRAKYFLEGRRNGYVVYEYLPKNEAENTILSKISDICISMKAEDYLSLPDCVDVEVPVVLDSKAKKAYTTLEKTLILELPESEDEISATNAAALSNKLLQLANGALYDDEHEWHEVHRAKLEAFTELIESLQGKPVLVFYNYQHDRERILKVLEPLRLKVRVLKNADDQDAWNRHEVDVLLTHPASSAYGLNLQEGGNHVVWFGLTWNYELYVQANKRLHRQGQKEKVIIHHLVSQETRDSDVMKALARKEDVQSYVLESLKARIQKYRSDN